MEHSNGRVADSKSELRTSSYRGTVWRDPMLSAPSVDVGGVFFEPGARTHWHSHNDGQLLFVTQGRGLVVTRDGEIQAIQPADVVYAPPGEQHWHGAAPDSYLIHTSVALGQTEWFEEVSDGQYRAATETT